jgi:serine/threonine protein kinase
MLRFPRLPRSTALTIDGSSPGSTPAAFGPFRVLHQVGAGTTGLVFRAHDQVEGRLVAIKAFRLDLTPERAAELASALQALSGRGLSHPSMAAPIAAGVEDGIAWFAQAYIPAESLDSALRQYGPPPVADALTIVTQLAGALDFAAAAGVLHGSLHPRDVLVAPGETHLIDLGVAAALEACGVRAPVRRPYSAPERGAGRPVSRAGDIFALGAIAFELLSGQPVTGAGDDVVVTLPDVPGANREALLETFSFALALAPDERYATALAFAAPLKRALGDALTRPAAPRKRRTTRPPEAVLPIGELESEPPVDPAAAAVPIIESSPEALSSDAFDPASWEDVPPSRIAPPRNDSEDARDRSRPHPRARHARGAQPMDDAAPVYVSGPTEPAPAVPAIEPIAEPGEADPMSGAGDDVRFSALDESRSPLAAAALNASVPSHDEWEMARDPGHSVLQPPVYAAAADEAFEPPAGDYDDRYAHARDHTNAPSRAPWLGLAAMLLVGLIAGLGGGWFLFSNRGNRPSGATPTETASGTGADARPREYTDDSVRPPAESAPKQTAAAPAAAAPPRPAPEPRAAAAPPTPAAASPVETPARGRLVVRTRPAGARVEVGGRSRGESPATVSDLAYGRHVVRVSREGYVTEQRRVTLSARQPAQTVDVTLKRTAPPATTSARSSAPAERFVGTLVVESRPAGAKVFVDGKGMGVTPVTIPEVRVGSHVVRLEMVGHRRWSTSIRVVAGERERVAASLEEEAVQ